MEKELIFFGYDRGSKVDFVGNDKYREFKNTHIWAILKVEGYSVAYIQHDDGLLKSEFKASVPFLCDTEGEMKEAIPETYFDPEVKYIEVIESEITLSDPEERKSRNERIINLIRLLEEKL